MKIISYNINSCNQNKVDQLFEQNADVYVVPEIACQDKIKIPDEYEMKWNSKLSALKEMFNSCDKLISIDLSDFDTTLVPIIETMFQSCLIQKNAINDCSNPCFNEPTIFNLEDENC